MPALLPLASMPPPLVLNSLDHGRQGLAALQHRQVLVHFFATWCEPCRAEIAGLHRLSERLAGTSLAVLAVDVGEPPTRIRRFFANEFADRPPPFPILVDEDRAAMKAWNVAFLPTTYLLGADHTVRLAAAGPVDWDDRNAVAALQAFASNRPLPAAFTLPVLPDTSGSNEQ